jgi:hypothetical protein
VRDFRFTWGRYAMTLLIVAALILLLRDCLGAEAQAPAPTPTEEPAPEMYPYVAGVSVTRIVLGYSGNVAQVVVRIEDTTNQVVCYISAAGQDCFRMAVGK